MVRSEPFAITILTVFAIWKATSMLMNYDGPLEVIKVAREAINKLQEQAGRKVLNFECFFCLSTVVAAPPALLLADGWAVLIYWFGLSGIAWFLNVIDERYS